MALFAGAVSAAAWFLIMCWRRQEVEREAFAKLLSDHHLSRTEAQLIDKVATGIGVTPREVATQIDVFERATAAELRQHAVPTAAGDQGVFGEVAGMRKKLGFQQRGGNFALLTTRELDTGQAVQVGGAPATVTEVNEAFFVVNAPSTVGLPTPAVAGVAGVGGVAGGEACPCG